MDVMDDLAGLRTAPAGAVAVGTVEADLARGRHAVLMRRRRRIAIGGAATACALATLAAVALPAATQPSTKQNSAASTGIAGAAQGTDQIRLVSYTGVQPHGFTLRWAPAGWYIAERDQYLTVLVPRGTTAAQPASPGQPSTGPAGPSISIALPSLDEKSAGPAPYRPGPTSSHDVRINGQRATIVRWPAWSKYRTPAAAQLTFVDPQGRRVELATPVSLTDAQIVRLAEGITVTSAAKGARG